MATRPDAQSDELRRLMQRLFRRFGTLAAEATPCGKPLPMAYAHALMVLLGRGDASQQELGRELGIDKSNVARLCARMVEAGHVSQRPDEEDGRSRRVSLTTRGERLAREVDESSRARFGALLVALPSTSREPVLDALRQLVAGIEASAGPKTEGGTPS
ncbi:MAG: winged helix-turn-helix transcriptional regulator [Labilithrix sp.]|nr:winged helix-turn-helix transcriptional regulator [Labilithrix sp.]